MGIGATATIWGALAHRYVAGHFAVARGGRHIALLGDAELDEGAVWEAVADPMVERVGEVLWVVDVNRQSLDRVVPDIAVTRRRPMFEAAGWHDGDGEVRPPAARLFDHDGGDALRDRIDTMGNEEYQRMLRAARASYATGCPPETARRGADIVAARDLDDSEIARRRLPTSAATTSRR